MAAEAEAPRAPKAEKPAAEPETVAEVVTAPEPEPLNLAEDTSDNNVELAASDSDIPAEIDALLEDSDDDVINLSEPVQDDDAFVLDAGSEEEDKDDASIASGDEKDVKAAPRIASGGGTLFERMANLSRSEDAAADGDDDDNEGGGLNIPRFLNRQNNQ
jgi:cell division protein FtsZ